MGLGKELGFGALGLRVRGLGFRAIPGCKKKSDAGLSTSLPLTNEKILVRPHKVKGSLLPNNPQMKDPSTRAPSSPT